MFGQTCKTPEFFPGVTALVLPVIRQLRPHPVLMPMSLAEFLMPETLHTGSSLSGNGSLAESLAEFLLPDEAACPTPQPEAGLPALFQPKHPKKPPTMGNSMPLLPGVQEPTTLPQAPKPDLNCATSPLTSHDTQIPKQCENSPAPQPEGSAPESALPEEPGQAQSEGQTPSNLKATEQPSGEAQAIRQDSEVQLPVPSEKPVKAAEVSAHETSVIASETLPAETPADTMPTMVLTEPMQPAHPEAQAEEQSAESDTGQTSSEGTEVPQQQSMTSPFLMTPVLALPLPLPGGSVQSPEEDLAARQRASAEKQPGLPGAVSGWDVSSIRQFPWLWLITLVALMILTMMVF